MAEHKARQVSESDWKAEAARRFGPDPMAWRFVCPVCGHVASVKDWRDAGAGNGEVAFSCVGRHRQGAKDAFAQGDASKGCTYAGGGLFRLNPVHVVREDGQAYDVFEFAAPVVPPSVTLDGRLA